MSTNSILVTSSGTHQLSIRVANTVWTRFCGLMFTRRLRDFEGLLITRCSSVHSSFMRYPIDLVYLDSEGIVTRCVSGLRPWRGSFSGSGLDREGTPYQRAAHTLELAYGAVAGLSIRPGDRLRHPYLHQASSTAAMPKGARQGQRGSAMIEFAVVGPIITMLGLSILQYGMLFFAKNQINYAGFMAAREGATAHADLAAAHAAYVRALVPLYGGGQTPAELATSLAKANADLGANGSGNVNIELLNPTIESFADWNDPALQAALKTGSRRVIPNAGQAFKSQEVRASSGQTIQDANLIKLRVTHGYLPKVPLINKLYTTYLKWLDPGTDAFHSKLVNEGRIPVVTHVTLQMQSDAIEPDSPVSMPGPGNNGNPSNPGDPPISTKPPPDCTGPGCIPSDPVPPACNPLTDPSHCIPNDCDPNGNMCCIPDQWRPK